MKFLKKFGENGLKKVALKVLNGGNIKTTNHPE